MAAGKKRAMALSQKRARKAVMFGASINRPEGEKTSKYAKRKQARNRGEPVQCRGHESPPWYGSNLFFGHEKGA